MIEFDVTAPTDLGMRASCDACGKSKKK